MQRKIFKFTLGIAVGIAGLALTSGCVSAQQGFPTAIADQRVAVETLAPAATDVPAAAGPGLWKVSDPDTTIYLFGTVHALPDGINWYNAPIASAFNSSDELVTEVDVAAKDDAAIAQLTMEKAIFTDGTTLHSLLTKDQAAIYDKAVTALGLPANAFDQVEPWLAGLTLSVLPLVKEGYDPKKGVEQEFVRLANGAKKFTALETNAYQISLFDNLPREDQVTFLISAAEQSSTIKQTLDKMVAAWIKGDVDTLAQTMNAGFDGDENLAEILLYNRNKNWAKWIDTRLKVPGTVFMAVGAGHLAGPKSVQEFLQSKNLKVERIQ